MAINQDEIREFFITQPTLFEIEEAEIASSDFKDPAEVLRQSEIAKTALEARLGQEIKKTDVDGNAVPYITWASEYFALINSGWKWKVAAFIAWASSKKIGRYPETQEKLAKEILGLNSDRVISTWRKRNPGIDEAIGVMQTYPTVDYIADAIQGMVISAAQPNKDGNRDRKLYFEMMGLWQPSIKVKEERKPGENELAAIPTSELKKMRDKLSPGSEQSIERETDAGD